MINFQPKSGSVLWCDYEGFIIPEMIKRRPVIIISKHKKNSSLVLVVPISTKMPKKEHYTNIELPRVISKKYFKDKRMWLKSDMINVVSLNRLFLIKNTLTVPNIDESLVQQIKDAIVKFYCLN